MMMMRRRIKMMTAMAKLKTKYDRIASDLPTFQKYATSQIPMKAKIPVKSKTISLYMH